MSLYVDLSIHKIEIVKPKRDLKPVLKLRERFMDATIREARKLGYEYMWCCAHTDNTPSIGV